MADVGGQAANGGAAAGHRGASGAVRDGRLHSGGTWEDAFGYSRAVAAGDFVLVSGCTCTSEGAEDDPYEQTKGAFEVALRALAAFGLGAEDVVRTRMYITHQSDAEEVGRAHADLFAAVRPAATMVAVAALLDPGMLVEVEVDAFRSGAGRAGAGHRWAGTTENEQ